MSARILREIAGDKKYPTFISTFENYVNTIGNDFNANARFFTINLSRLLNFPGISNKH